MASLARTVVRFAGALALGGVAAVFDTREATAPRREVLTSQIATRKSPAATIRLEPGKRAFGVRVPRTAPFELGVRPNGRVDVIARQGPSAPESSAVLLKDARVLAVTSVPRRTGDSGSGDELVVTLEVTPDQAARIAMAQANGTLGLTVPPAGK